MFVVASLATALISWFRPSKYLTLASAITLVAAVIVAIMPTPGASVVLSIITGTLCLALAVIGGGPAASVVLQLATRGSSTFGVHGGILLDGGRREVLRGGLTIGLLERAAIAGTLIAGFPEGLAVVVAIKGVGRFTELSDAEAQERFIIGTFASVLWACIAASISLLVRGGL
ncbi:hypothetical protein DF220_13415 [Salinibacterium hongtaonis]|uniref:Uncharacterized protein n=2 Tax=Homoserinimonas hongtaonis TaxID=2079791 RepID=A0A2U1SXP5_9MICO|nr:hypothetical protein C2138_04725 [Salinibacterium hongtaonis]PWB96405.1 hypothetical protein DF220_13415 [Salinibacterium hongtaonis]